MRAKPAPIHNAFGLACRLALWFCTTVSGRGDKVDLGIVGGGQLGRMLVEAARRLQIECITLDPQTDAPAAGLSARHLVGGLFDEASLRELASSSRVTTIEIESTDADALGRLEQAGHVIAPRPSTLKIIQNKLLQKQMLEANGIPTSRFEEMAQPSAGAVRRFGLPAVQKLQRGGYDGRGVHIMRRSEDLAGLLSGPSLIEAYVPAVMELAVVGARTRDGEIRCYNVVDMSLSPATNMLEMLKAPADIPDRVAARALEVGQQVIAALDDTGLVAVELFLTEDERILVNEVSPRTHNSGHFTIDACVTSQFEQHIRAVLGMPLGDTTQTRPAVMINLLGAPGFEGPPVLEGEKEARAIDDVHIHLYGKTDCRAHRKMGHVTVLGATLGEAAAKADRVRSVLSIRGSHRLPTAGAA